MDSTNNTHLFDVKMLASANVKLTVKEVASTLEERGYNAINQLVGYLMSGDPGFISNYKGAREKILTIDRAELIAYILKDYLS